MKKSFLIIAFLMLILIALAGSALADWNVSVTWTRSVGPNLASEAVLLNGVSKCTVTPPASTACQFTVPSLTGQAVVVRSINAQGAFSETTPILISSVPAPATGVLINITYVAP